jgi:hypothetical protein
VHVDPAGRDEEIVRVDLAPAAPRHLADLRDDAAVHRDVGLEAGAARAVDDGLSPNHHVMHSW